LQVGNVGKWPIAVEHWKPIVSEVLKGIRIVLVETSHPGNIGGAARAMKTMGLSDLVLVNPKRYPDPQAQWRAAGAQDVLEAARVCADLTEAIEGCHWVVGTSTRSRRIPWPVLSPEEVARQAVERAGSSIAILFGREANGLSNEELQRCHCHLQIPAAPDYPSLNVAMAVQVVCYELRKLAGEAGDEIGAWDRPTATVAQLDGLIEHLEEVMVASGFLDAANPGQTMTRLRRLFSRMEPDTTEVQILRGILTHLHPLRRPGPGE
jgi:tRNA (cytidine32/uridine32-2'-O)-methyltransferase